MTRHGQALSRRALERTRATGALSRLPIALLNRSANDLMAGELVAVASLVDEIQTATEATRSAMLPYTALLLAGLQGREAELSQLIKTTVADAVARGEGHTLTVGEVAKAILYTGLSRYADALAVAREAAEHDHEIAVPMLALPELVRGGRSLPRTRAGRRCARAADRDDHTQRHRLGARSPGPLAGACERRHDRRESLPGGDRTAQAHPRPNRPCPRPPALRRMAAASTATRRRPPPAAPRA